MIFPHFNALTGAEQVVVCLQRIYAMQLTTASGGNVSVRDSDGNVWISPAGVDKSRLTVDDIVCVAADGQQHGKHSASSELPFHQAIYRSRPGLQVVLHAHPDALVAFSAVRQLPDVSLLAGKKTACGQLGFVDYAMTGSDLLGEKIAAGFAAGGDSLILENHGVVIAAGDMQTAFERFDALVHLAESQIYAAGLSRGDEATEILTVGDGQWTGNSDPQFSLDSKAIDNRLAEEICDYSHRACQQRLFTSTSGWMAVRDGQSMIVNRIHADRANIQPGQLLRVDLHAGTDVDSSGLFRCFLKLFEQHDDIDVVFFAQPAHMMGFNLSGHAFNSRIIPEAFLFLRDVECQYSIDPGIISHAISSATPVLMIKNQGVLVTGKSLFQAFDRLEVAEFTAKALISATALGVVNQISDAGIEEMSRAFDLPDANE